jgi:hypothetical protein
VLLRVCVASVCNQKTGGSHRVNADSLEVDGFVAQVGGRSGPGTRFRGLSRIDRRKGAEWFESSRGPSGRTRSCIPGKKEASSWCASRAAADALALAGLGSRC